MQRHTHRLLGAASGLGLGALAGWPWPQAAAAAGLAAITAAGATSPDMDQYKWWARVTIVMPRGARAHRGLTHWWGLPLAALGPAALVPAEVRWVAAALIVGWVSHLFGDWIFGAGSAYRPAGIPLSPWSGHTGWGIRCGGVAEKVTAYAVLPAVLLALGTTVLR